jgi:DNA repair exonuclease SbcCD ATPase subunit
MTETDYKTLASDLALKLVTEQAKREAALLRYAAAEKALAEEKAARQEMQTLWSATLRSQAASAASAAEKALAEEQVRLKDVKRELAAKQAKCEAMARELVDEHALMMEAKGLRENAEEALARETARAEAAEQALKALKALTEKMATEKFRHEVDERASTTIDWMNASDELEAALRAEAAAAVDEALERADRLTGRWTAVPLVDADGNPTAWPNYAVSIAGEDGAAAIAADISTLKAHEQAITDACTEQLLKNMGLTSNPPPTSIGVDVRSVG